MKRRNADGSFRGKHQPDKLSARTIHARWLEEEVLKRKVAGVATFQSLAEQISKIGRRELPPLVAFPPGLVFEPDYSISAVACWKALRNGLKRGPRLAAEEMRDVDTDRLEDGIRIAQNRARKGDRAALRDLAHLIQTKAKINGYVQPQKLEVTGKAGGPLEVQQMDETKIAERLDRLTPDEQIDFLRLYSKASGGETLESRNAAEGRNGNEE